MASASARAQDAPALTVTAVDGATRTPLAGAMVSVGGRMQGATDAGGVVRVAVLAKGPYLLEVARMGYATVRAEVTIGDQPLAQTVEMGAQPLALAPVEAQARRTARQRAVEEFHQRGERGHTGYRLTREDIARLRPRRVSDLFRSLPGVRVSDGGGGAAIESRRTMPGPVAACAIQYYVDGVPHATAAPDYRGVRRFLIRALRPGVSNEDMESLMETVELTAKSLLESIDAEFKPEDLEGIEVYPGGNGPSRYQGSSGRCGVVLIWTIQPGT